MSMMVSRYEAVVLLSSRPLGGLLCCTFFVRAGCVQDLRRNKNLAGEEGES